MSELRQYPREFIKDFIEIYRKNECLWKISGRDYKNKDKKARAYEQLRGKLFEVNEDATIDAVKKMIKSIRSTYKRELKRVLVSLKKRGPGTCTYKPLLWYYNELIFLRDEKISQRVELTMEKKTVTKDKNPSQDSTHSSELDEINGRNGKKKQLGNVSLNDSESLRSIAAQNYKIDAYDIYGRYLITELRQLRIEDYPYVQKLFNEILFEAKVGHIKTTQVLSENTLRPSFDIELIDPNEEDSQAG